VIGDPRDRTAYAVAIAGLGLALVVALTGICWLASQHGAASTDVFTHSCALHTPRHCRPALLISHKTLPLVIPAGLQIAAATLGGVLVGALVPFPPWPLGLAGGHDWVYRVCDAVLFAVSIVLLVFIVLYLFGSTTESLRTGAALGLLLGLLIPSPARGD
jgi:hypothetical protein